MAVQELGVVVAALDTENVEPMSHAGATRLFREDAPGTSLKRDRALDGAPDPADGLFRVPKVIA